VPIASQRAALALDALADREGFVVAWPQGIEERWNYGRQLNVPMSLAGGAEVDDIAFFRALIARLIASQRVDPKRVYLLGVSNGALMAYRAACDMGGDLAAGAAFISSMSDLQQEDCPRGMPVPLFILAGSADTFQSYLGAPGRLQGRLVSVPDTFRFFRSRNRCSSIQTDDGAAVTVFRAMECERGAEVVLHRVNGGGHDVPTSAPAEAWAFLRRFVRN
jgi:polyhydroxybutyrate depolymerase